MKILKLKLASTRFAFVLGNRQVNEKKLLKEIRKDGQVFVAINGMYYRDIKDFGIKLIDVQTGKIIENPSDDTFVVLDGQHRTVCALRLYQESQNLETDSEGTSCSKSFSDYIYANIPDAEDFQVTDVITHIMRLNSLGSGWKSGDYITSAYVRKENDKMLEIINDFKRLGFPISTTSRYLFFDHKVLTTDTLTKYVNGDDRLTMNVNCERGMEIYRLLLRVGFSVKFLSKRYMIDSIIKMNNKGALDTYLDAISSLSIETVEEIENMNPVDYDMDKIQSLIMNSKSDTQETDDIKPFVVCNSPERLDENIELLHTQVEETLAKRAVTKTKSERRPALKSTRDKPSLNNLNKYENYSFNDIQ